MSPEIIAAIIAAVVSSVTVFSTLTAQARGRRETLDAQHQQWERTFEEQRQQLEKTFEEQRQQWERTFEEQRIRILNERFDTAADKLDSNKPPVIQLAGVFAMAALADNWKENRQACANVLCAYLRAQENLANRDVRNRIIRVITERLRKDKGSPWEDLEFDFTGAVFDGADFSDARVHRGSMIFDGVEFASGTVSFHGAEFSESTLNFQGARFTGGTLSFAEADFAKVTINFQAAQFHSGMLVFKSKLYGSKYDFFKLNHPSESALSRLIEKSTEDYLKSFGDVTPIRMEIRSLYIGGFKDSTINFCNAMFCGADISFAYLKASTCGVGFEEAKFDGSKVYFDCAVFENSPASFLGAVFSSGTVDFTGSYWSIPPEFDGKLPGEIVKLPWKRLDDYTDDW